MANQFLPMPQLRHATGRYIPAWFVFTFLAIFALMYAAFSTAHQNVIPLENQTQLTASGYRHSHAILPTNAIQGIQLAIGTASVFRTQAQRLQNTIYFLLQTYPIFLLDKFTETALKNLQVFHFQLQKIIPARAGPAFF